MLKPAQNNHNQQGGIRLAGGSLMLSLFGFAGDSIVDGPGLRCVIFCQGCPHTCSGCHNPASHPFKGGEVVALESLYQRIAAYPLCRGVTLSGGEPFCQPEPLLALTKRLKADGKELAAYTGYTFEQLCCGTPTQQALLAALDTLIDGPFVLAERNLSLRFRGSANQRILNVPQSLAAGAAVWETARRWIG